MKSEYIGKWRTLYDNVSINRIYATMRRKKINKNPKKLLDLKKRVNDDSRSVSQFAKKLNIKDPYKLPKIFYAEGLGDILDICNHVMESDHNDDNDSSSKLSMDDDDIDKSQDDSCLSESEISEDFQNKKDIEFENIAKAHKSIIAAPKLNLLKSLEVVNRDEKLGTLAKSIKVLLNKLTDSNMNILLNQYKELVTKNGFNDTTDELCKAFQSFIIQSTMLPDRFILIHSTFISVLHFVFGNEFIFTFLRILILQYQSKLEQLLTDNQSKHCQNAIVVICILYFLGSIGIELIKDIINKCIERFIEPDIEIILMILKYCGFYMRKKEPLVLKTIIQSVHNQVKINENLSKRATFMLEILSAIQHNNPSKVTDYDPLLFEHFEKIHKDILKNSSQEGQQININYEDILTNEQTNKWWLVGSAYSGPSIDGVNNKLPQVQQYNSKKYEWSPELTNAAKNQKYTTKTKIDIFCTLMTSEGCENAYNSLLRLNLKGNDRDEIIRIIVSCCVQEKTYNDFYAEVIPYFVKDHRTFKSTLQFCIWDILRKLNDFKKFSKTNIQQLIVDLFRKDSLRITLFKIVEFDRLDGKYKTFYTELFVNLLSNSSMGILKNIFSPLFSIEKLENLREMLIYFIMVNISNDSKYSSLQNKVKMVSCFAKGYDPDICSL